MMMQYRRSRNAKRFSALQVLLYGCVLAALFFVDGLLGGPVKSVIQTVTTPVLMSVHSVTTQKIASYFVSKESLIREKSALERRIAELEYEQRSHGVLHQDAKHYCAIDEVVTETVPSTEEGAQPVIIQRTIQKPGSSLGSDSASRVHATGRVIAYERVLLGTFIVFFEGNRPTLGDFVLDDVGQPVGVVSAVYEHTAIVQLLTMVQTTHEVRIGKVSAQAHGRLSNTFIAFIPQEEPVEVGDTVSLTALNMPLGSVVHIERSPADAQVLLYIRPFAQPLQTHFVSFVPNPLKEIHD